MRITDLYFYSVRKQGKFLHKTDEILHNWLDFVNTAIKIYKTRLNYSQNYT